MGMKFGGVGSGGCIWEELKGGVWVNMIKIYEILKWLIIIIII